MQLHSLAADAPAIRITASGALIFSSGFVRDNQADTRYVI